MNGANILSPNATRRSGPSENKTANSIVMVKMYNELPCLRRENDPLVWWRKSKGDDTCVLFIDLVNKYLCIPTTSVESE